MFYRVFSTKYSAFKGIQNKIIITSAAKAIWGMLYAIL